jgi:hypothetical protein
MEDIMDLSSFPEPEYIDETGLIAGNDNDAADIFIRLYKPIVVKSEGIIYCYTDNNTWTYNEKQVHNTLLKKCLTANIRSQDILGNTHAYSANVGSAKHIIEAVKAKIEDNKAFAEELFDGSIKKLFFKDGYYDFNTRSFVKSLAPEHSLTTIRLSYDFPVRIDADVLEVKEKIFQTTISDDLDICNNYYQYIARAVAGEITDKNWLIGMGFRDCGKSSCITANEYTFEKYCKSANANCFLLDNSSGDENKKLSWLVDFQYVRLCHTSEVTTDDNGCKARKLDGNLIKKFTSGGDTLTGRKNHKDEVTFRTQAKMLNMLNECPSISPKDTLETAIIINFPFKYYKKDLYPLDNTNPRIRLADETIKDYIKSEKFRNAYIHIILDAYKPHPVILCEPLIQRRNDFNEDNGDETTIVKRHFEFTNDTKDGVHSLTIKRWFEEQRMNMSLPKLKTMLEFLGAKHNQNVNVNGKIAIGYKYMKIKPKEMIEEENNEF